MTGVRAQLRRAEVMLGAGRFSDAITLLAPVVAAEPDNSRAWALLAQAQLGGGNPADGLAAASRAVQLDPAADWPHRLRSIGLRRTGNARQAVDAAFEACRLQPHHWMNHFNLAQAALGATADIGPGGQSGLAIAAQASATARQLAPSEPSAHYVSGQVSRACGNKEEAQAHFEQTLVLDPEHSSAVNELGRLKLDGGKSGAAAAHFVQAARIAPREGVYGHNVDVAVSRAERSVASLVRWVIYVSWLVVILALGVAGRSVADRLALLAVLVLAALVVGAVWQIQLRRMPRQARPLFRGRSMLLALGMSLGALLLGVSALEFAPDQSGVLLLPVVAGMLAARYLAFRILRSGARKRYEQIAGRSAVVRP